MPRVFSLENALQGFSNTGKGIAQLQAQQQQIAQNERRLQLAEAESRLRAAAADEERQQRIANQKAVAAFAEKYQAVKEGREAAPPKEPALSDAPPMDVSVAGLDTSQFPEAQFQKWNIDREQIKEDAAFEAKIRGRSERLNEALKGADPQLAMRLIQQDMALMEMEKQDFHRQRLQEQIQDNLAANAYVIDGDNEMEEGVAARVDQMMELLDAGAPPEKVAEMNAQVLESINEAESAKLRRQGAIDDISEYQNGLSKSSQQHQQYESIKQRLRRGTIEPEDAVDEAFELRYGRKTARATGADDVEKRTKVIDKINSGSFGRVMQARWDKAKTNEERDAIVEEAKRIYFGERPASTQTSGTLAEEPTSLERLRFMAREAIPPNMRAPFMLQQGGQQPPVQQAGGGGGQIRPVADLRREDGDRYGEFKKKYLKLMKSDGSEIEIEALLREYSIDSMSLYYDPELNEELSKKKPKRKKTDAQKGTLQGSGII